MWLLQKLDGVDRHVPKKRTRDPERPLEGAAGMRTVKYPRLLGEGDSGDLPEPLFDSTV
jgi:hypothetical protein